MPKYIHPVPAWLNLRNKEAQKAPMFYLSEEGLGDSSLLRRFLFQDLLPTFLNLDVRKYRLGILYDCDGHITPLVIDIEKEAFFHGEEETQVSIFNTDSRSYDVNGGNGIRDNLISLVQDGFRLGHKIYLYANGLIQADYESSRRTIRQHADGYCGLYSMVDIETLCAITDLKSYFRNTKEAGEADFLPNTVSSDLFGHTRLHHIESLPAEMLLYTQSVHGTEDGERIGLAQLCKEQLSPGKVRLNAGASSASCSEQDISPSSSKGNLLKRYLSDNVHRGKFIVDIVSLLAFIQSHNIAQNFFMDAIAEMYDSQVDEIDLTEACEFDIRNFPVARLQQMMLDTVSCRQRTTSPLQSFVFSMPVDEPPGLSLNRSFRSGASFFSNGDSQKPKEKPRANRPTPEGLERNRFYLLAPGVLRALRNQKDDVRKIENGVKSYFQ
jgi:hypothetical protein